MRKVLFVSVVLASLLCVSMIAFELRAQSVDSVDFIVFSDTHIGKGLSSQDQLTSYERYAMLLGSTNQYSAGFMVNCGDLTDGWYLNNTQQIRMYQDYLRLGSKSRNTILNIKGNHDANNTAFWSMIGVTTIGKVYGDIQIVGIGCRADGADEWLSQGVTYAKYQADAINRTIYSSTWNQTSYHFLFMHFEPDSTWPIPAKLGVPIMITQYCRYFDLVFCGHESGCASVLHQRNATVIHVAHLADGRLATDTYVTVKIIRDTRTITLVSYNFAVGINTPLFSFQKP